MAKVRFTTPVMRMVQGDVDEAQTKDMQGNLRVVKTGPNAGQPNPQFFVGGAVAKTDPAWPPFWETLVRQAFADFPSLFPHGIDAIIAAGGPQPWFTEPPQGHQMPWVMGDFSWKVQDGDASVVREGKLVNYAEREGYAGSWVVKFGSSYPPRCFHAGRYAANEQIQEKKVIRRGYYVRVSGSTEGNGNMQRPGIYLNLDMVELSAFGPEIVSGPDAGSAFGGGPVALPPGATAAPATPAAPGAPAAPLAPAPAAAATGAPATAYAGTAAPTPPVAPVAGGAPAPNPVPAAPYTGYMGNAAAPAASPPPAPTASVSPATASPSSAVPPPAPPAPVPTPPVAAGPVMLPAAGGASYEAMIAAGWTDDTMRANGMMA